MSNRELVRYHYLSIAILSLMAVMFMLMFYVEPDMVLVAFLFYFVSEIVVSAEEVLFIKDSELAIQFYGAELCEFVPDECEDCGKTAPLYYMRTCYWNDEGDYCCIKCLVDRYRRDQRDFGVIDRIEINNRAELNRLYLSTITIPESGVL